MQDNTVTLAQLVYKQAIAQPDKAALVIDNRVITYHSLVDHARALADKLRADKHQRIGIFSSRTLSAYVGILAAQWNGITFITLNPAFPLKRLQKIVKSAGLDGIIADEADLALAKTLGEAISLSQLSSHSTSPFKSVAKNDLAYILFTSGSTGEPKGVPVTYGNFTAFYHAVRHRYTLTPDDRVSQFSHLTFDVAFFDMILAWGAGAALYVVPDEFRIAPGPFIRDNGLTVWLSVPAVISTMKKMKMLGNNVFPSLKYSLFTGDVLYNDQVSLWQSSAPQSQIENLYGPTEATVDCLGYIVDRSVPIEHAHGKVPIGKPFLDVKAALIHENNTFVSTDEPGELVLSGDQVVESYWQLPILSQEKFITLSHPEYGSRRWYRTGDLCSQDTLGNFHYQRRIDAQCKFLGYRIELQEIEFYLRQLTNTEVVALIIDHDSENPQLVAVIQQNALDVDTLRQQLAQFLPVYMIPSRFIAMEDLPYSHHDKVDRNKLHEIIRRALA